MITPERLAEVSREFDQLTEDMASGKRPSLARIAHGRLTEVPNVS